LLASWPRAQALPGVVVDQVFTASHWVVPPGPISDVTPARLSVDSGMVPAVPARCTQGDAKDGSDLETALDLALRDLFGPMQ
jgi:hypothetical protein